MALRERAAPACGVAIALGCVALYWPIRAHEWVSWDDFAYITHNPWIARGLTRESVGWALSSFYLANWFPLTWLSWMLDYDLHGFDAGAFLTTNLLLHAANSTLLFVALRRMSGATARSAFVAAVFAVHPLHVESVAWAAARKDVLSGLFWMLAMWAHGSGLPAGRRRVAVALCFALGFAAKPTLITLPFALLLLDDWPLARTRGADGSWDPVRVRAAVADKAGLFAMALVFAAVVFLAQRSGGTVLDTDALPVRMRLKNAAVSVFAYLGDAVFPRELAFFYPHPGDAIGAGMALACAAALAALTALCIAAARRRPYLAVGWLWFGVTLAPVIGLVQIGAQARADRYMYLPLIGLSIIVAWGVPEWIRGARARRFALPALATVALAALSLRAAAQIRTWRDSVALYEHALRVTAHNHVAHAHLGDAYLRRGRVGDAIAQYEAALRASPDYTSVANNLAWVLATTSAAAQRDPARAVALAERAMDHGGADDPAVLDTLAAAYAAAGRFGAAVDAATRAVALARERGDAALLSAVSERLAGYRASQPYREGP